MFPILFLGACGGEGTPEVTPPLTADAWDAAELVPSRVEFDTNNEPVVQTIRIVNRGDLPVKLLRVDVDAPEVTFTLPEVPILPGKDAYWYVHWTPVGQSGFSSEARVQIEVGGRSGELPLDLSGSARWGTLEVGQYRLVFDEVTVGCKGKAALTLWNIGESDLTIRGLSFADGASFSTVGDGWLSERIEPQQSRQFGFLYTPLQEGTNRSALSIASDDPLQPIVEVQVIGTAVPAAPVSVSYTALGSRPVTALFAVNATVVNGAFADEFQAALPVFFETLGGLGVPYRVAFVLGVGGLVAGDVAFIDESFTAAAAVAAVQGMLEAGPADNDELLESLDNGLAQNRSWLLDEDALWGEAALALVAINDDVEQSPGNATSYLLSYEGYKADPRNLTVDAITGDFPDGCAGAEPSEQLYLAAQATGGAFLSICADDWTSYMQTLAEVAARGNDVFPVDGVADVSSIAVWVDRVAIATGWTYDATRGGVIFEAGREPEAGAEVRIEYVGGECSG